MNRTTIGWCDVTWNPIVGCTKGCEYCYARGQAKRQRKNCELCYEFKPHLHWPRLQDKGLLSKKPRRIFLGSMGDLFDPCLTKIVHDTGYPHTDKYLGIITRKVLDVCAQHPRHTFIILTKRPDIAARHTFPPNVHLGVSVTNQADADERIPELLKCPAAPRWVSYEPVHGPVDFERWLMSCRDCGNQGSSALFDFGFSYPTSGLNLCTEHCIKEGESPSVDWLIIGAETGNRKGKIVPECKWIASAFDQCREMDVPVFVKENVVKLYPEFAGIQEYPESRLTTEGTEGGEVKP